MNKHIIVLFILVTVCIMSCIGLVMKDKDNDKKFAVLGQALYVGITEKQFEDQNYYTALHYVLNYNQYMGGAK